MSFPLRIDPGPPMLHVSLFVELLRSRPRFMMWAATLAQAALWWLVPVIFYSAPPGDLALTIAVGGEFNLGSFWGPPLAYWLANIAFVIAGMPGVYLLAQACVVVTYWAVFRLGQSIVGIHHAALAILLMIGISALSVPTPTFGPPVLAMPLTALALLHFWRALGEGKRSYSFLLAGDLALLILTTHSGLILLGAIIVFTLASERGRAMLMTIEPWIAAIIIVVILFPHLIWLDMSGMGWTWLSRLRYDRPGEWSLVLWLRQLAAVAVAHTGALVLVALSSGWGDVGEKPPVFQRKPLTDFERWFVLFFAIALPLATTVVGASLGERSPVGRISPNVVLSGLALVVLAGNAIELHRQWLTGLAWSVLLIAPPAFAAFGLLAAPFYGDTPIPTAQPAKSIGRFFGETFERRTGKRLEIVAGDPRLASLIALYARGRPSLYLANAPERTPWVTAEELKQKGGIVVWTATDTAGAPPPEIRFLFPDIVPEVPHTFDYFIQGRLPLLRVGWGMLRPQ
ncbi:MAG: glycosyltransferase family 39 protein [Rhodoplanes sp.]